MHEAPSSNRIVFDSDESIKYKIFHLDNPHRIVIDLKNTRPKRDLDVNSMAQSSKRFVSVRGADRGGGYRFVIETENKIPFKAFILDPVASYGHRLVVDLKMASPASISSSYKLDEKVGLRTIQVVIDPCLLYTSPSPRDRG